MAPPGLASHHAEVGGARKPVRTQRSFTTRAREAGCSVAARDNTHLRGNIARGLVTHLHADAAMIAKHAHMPNGVSKLQLKVWNFFEDPASSRAAKHFSFFMMTTIIVSVLNFCFASVPECKYIDYALLCRPHDDTAQPWFFIEAGCIMIFSVEFVLRLLCCPAAGGVLSFCRNPANVIDLVAIMPWYIDRVGLEGPGFLSLLRIIRITRIARIFKMSKNMQGMLVLARTLQKSVSALSMLVFLVMLTLVLFSTVIYFLEGPSLGSTYDPHRKQWVRPDGSPTPFESIPASMWWCLVTMTTVGYGDIYPVSGVGQLTAMLAMFWGLVVLSLPITIVGANFDEEYREMKKRKKDD